MAIIVFIVMATIANLAQDQELSCPIIDIPDFKMPLYGGREWKLTVEVGGKAYNGEFDTGHLGKLFYSLDFGRENKGLDKYKIIITNKTNMVLSVSTYETITNTNIVVLSVASGVVHRTGGNTNLDPYRLNGYFVGIDHDFDGKDTTGFQSTYCHLKYPPMVTVGEIVFQGQMIGIMGDTGENPATGEKTSDGIHLHITFYYQGNATNANSILALNLLRMEGRLLKDYKLSTNWMDDHFEPAFYPSSNETPEEGRCKIPFPPKKLRILPR
jgi:hypothetical protein